MFCTKCGQKVEDGMMFCTNCGNRIQSAPQQPVAPQNGQGYMDQPAAPMYGGSYAAPQKKKKTGLIVGLSVGGAVVVIAIILLLVLLPGGGYAGLVGKWYDESGYYGTVEFRGNGTVQMESMGISMSGTYTFDEKDMTGDITISYLGASDDTSFVLNDDRLNIDGVWYTRDVVNQMDYDSYMDDLDEYMDDMDDYLDDFDLNEYFN